MHHQEAPSAKPPSPAGRGGQQAELAAPTRAQGVSSRGWLWVRPWALFAWLGWLRCVCACGSRRDEIRMLRLSPRRAAPNELAFFLRTAASGVRAQAGGRGGPGCGQTGAAASATGRRRGAISSQRARGGWASWKGARRPVACCACTITRAWARGGFELERNGCIGGAGGQPTATVGSTRVVLHPARFEVGS